MIFIFIQIIWMQPVSNITKLLEEEDHIQFFQILLLLRFLKLIFFLQNLVKNDLLVALSYDQVQLFPLTVVGSLGENWLEDGLWGAEGFGMPGEVTAFLPTPHKPGQD